MVKKKEMSAFFFFLMVFKSGIFRFLGWPGSLRLKQSPHLRLLISWGLQVCATLPNQNVSLESAKVDGNDLSS